MQPRRQISLKDGTIFHSNVGIYRTYSPAQWNAAETSSRLPVTDREKKADTITDSVIFFFPPLGKILQYQKPVHSSGQSIL